MSRVKLFQLVSLVLKSLFTRFIQKLLTIDMEMYMVFFKRLPMTLILVLTLFSITAQASDFSGRIVKAQGDVYIIDNKGQKRLPEKSQFLISNNETLVTGKGGKAVVQYNDGALSVLSEESKIKVERSGWLSHLGGKIYYFFRKVSAKQKSKKVTTSFTTIGIRGTSFIVYDEGNVKQVALAEGKLNIESLDQPYEIHKSKTVDDFETFKRRMQEKRNALNQEYKEYKDKVSKYFIEYKKSFELEANQVINFTGNRVDQTDFSAFTKEDFVGFTHYAKDYIDAYKALEEAVH